MKILLVEDDKAVGAILKTFLEETGAHRVMGPAKNLSEAMDLAAAELPDIALIDIKLADSSTGYSVAATLRSLNVPSVFVTGAAPPFPMPELALGCLSKPFTMDDVTSLMRCIGLMQSGIRFDQPVKVGAVDFYSQQIVVDQPRSALPR